MIKVEYIVQVYYTILLIEIKIYNNIIYVDCVWKSMSEYFIDIKLRFCTIKKSLW